MDSWDNWDLWGSGGDPMGGGDVTGGWGLPNAGGDQTGDTSVGDSGWQVGQAPDGSTVYTDPQGNQYRDDGTPIGPNAPGNGANGPSSGGFPGPGGTGGGSGADSGGGTSLSDILKMLGGGAGLAGLFAPAISGLIQSKQNKDAQQQLQQAAKDANDLVSGIYDKSTAAYQPYTQMGAGAAGQLPGLVYKPGQTPDSNLAGQFGPLAGGYQPLGAGRGMTLGQMLKR